MKFRNLSFRGVELLVATAILPGVSACGSGENESRGRILTAAEPDSAERQRLSMMQRITLKGEDGSTWDIDIDAKDGSAVPFVSAIWGICEEKNSALQNLPCGVFAEANQLCVASLKEQIAQGEATFALQITKSGTSNTKWSVPPQSTNARTALLRQAYWDYSEVAFATIMNLVDDCPVTTLSGTPAVTSALGADLVQSQKGVLSASLAFADLAAAAADAQHRQGPSLEVDADRIMAGTQLSRAEAAHMLIGGRAGIHGTNRAVCRHAPLDASAKKALRILREAGVQPADVTSMDEFQHYQCDQSYRVPGGPTWPTINKTFVSTAFLVENQMQQGDVGMSGPTVSERLSLMLGHPITSVSGELGIGLDAFERARYALAEEMTFFGTYNVYDRLNIPGVSSLLSPAAVVATPRYDLPKEVYGAILRTYSPNVNSDRFSDELDLDWTTKDFNIDSELGGALETMRQYPSAPGRTWAKYVELLTTARTLAAIRWFAVRASSGLADGNYHSRIEDLKYDPTIQSALAPYLATVLNDKTITGRLNMKLDKSDPSNPVVTFNLDGFQLADKPTIVRGLRGLMCATTGTIWGAPCWMVDAELSPSFTFFTGNSTPTPLPSISMFEYFTGSTPVPLPDHIEQWYLVVPKDKSITSPGKGDYKAILGFVPDGHTRTIDDGSMQWWPIAPSLEARAAELIESQPEDCSLPSVSCSGVRFDERLALEDELSSDGEDVESSWKTYLQRAKDASSESDRLAEAYLQSGIESELWNVGQAERQEDLKRAREQMAIGALEKLQSICGTSVSPDVLLSLFGDGTGSIDLSKLSQGDCTAASTPPGTTCIAGMALSNWAGALSTADGGGGMALVKCIEALDQVVPIAALGDKKPCAWRGSDGVICSGASTSTKCPVYPDDASCAGVSKPTTASWLTGDNERTTMNLFGSSTTDKPGALYDVCARVREARRNPGAYSIEQLRSDVFALPVLSETNKRMSFLGEFGSYAALGVDGAPTFRTGTMTGGFEETRWPCGKLGRPSDCDPNNPDPDTFRCNYTDCGDLSKRADWNLRMMTAFAVSKYSTWRPGDSTNSMGFTEYYMGGPSWTCSGPQMGYPFQELPRTTQYVNTRTSSAVATGTLVPIDAYCSGGACVYDKPTTTASIVPFQLGNLTLDYTTSLGCGTGLFTILQGAGCLIPCQLVSANACKETLNSDDFHSAHGTFASRIWGGMASSAGSPGYVVRALSTEGRNAKQDWGPYALKNCAAEVALRIDYNSIMDAAELLCEVGLTRVGDLGDCSTIDVSSITSVTDLPRLAAFMECTSREIQDKARRAAFINYPRAAVDPMQRYSTGVYATEPGEIGQAYSDIRDAALQVETSAPIVAGALKGLGEEITTLKKQMEHYDIANQIADVQFDAQAASAMANCAFSLISAANTAGAASGGAVAACGNLESLRAYGDKLRDLSDQKTATEREIAISTFRTSVNGLVTTLRLEEIKVLQALETMRARLGKLDSLKQTAIGSLQSAVWYLSNQSAVAADAATVLGRHQALAQERYRRAHDNAVRLAFLAKMSIEQRLGMNLANLVEDLPLVDAPARWESSICASSPVDYSALKAKDPKTESFADAFVGDYVRKLENVVASYRLKYGFHEGSDTVVASLRDDILGVKTSCTMPSRNLLARASHMDTYVVDDGSNPTEWVVRGCKMKTTTRADGTVIATAKDNCVGVIRGLGAELGAGNFQLSFNNNGQCTGGDCGWQQDAAIGQSLELTPGKYIFSFYVDAPGAVMPRVVQPNGTALTITPTVGAPENGVVRMWLAFDVLANGNYFVGIRQAHENTVPSTLWSAVVAAPMLERVEGASQIATVIPGNFEDADSSGGVFSQRCPDIKGEAFRATRWQRGCEVLCPNGFQDSCDTEGKKYCYWETSFHLRQKDIEDGTVFHQSGFARGNFNYRIQSLALNFVGTGLQACDGTSPACYAGGYIPYTIIHDGPYYVRNHLGEEFEAKLFTGRIEHARGLGTERYITNPISSTDETLLQRYMRPEFSGRPLDGTFVVRVWDESNVNFAAIEDVQLVLNYSYWTRFQ